jgi:hypothetical protein
MIRTADSNQITFDVRTESAHPLIFTRYVSEILLTLFCDDDTLILHANSGRGLPQCWNNYMLFIFSLIRPSFFFVEADR